MELFHLNMPYGMEKNNKGEWCLFNRYYSHLGKTDHRLDNPEMYVHCPRMTDKVLLRMAETHSKSYLLGEDGKISRIWFYDSHTDPSYSCGAYEGKWKLYRQKMLLLDKYFPLK